MNTGRPLLVFDDPRKFPFYGGILSALGYDYVMCGSYEEGTHRVETKNFDFAIASQGSTNFEGRCVLERAAERHRNIPIVVVARCLDMQCYMEAMQLGAADYLERPAPDDLGWVLETQLRRRQTV